MECRRGRKFVEAASKGDRNIVSLLLGRGTDVNIVANNTTALIAAVEKGHKDIVSLLLRRGADMNMIVHDTTALVVAVEKGHKDIVSLLLHRGADVNMVVHDTTALVAAAREGYDDIALLLLDRGEDVNMVVNDTTALVTAAENGYDDVVSLLLGRGADVDMVVHNTTALVAAVEGRHKVVVSLLLSLDRGADVNMVVHDTTALVAVVETRDRRWHLGLDIVSLLLDRGADVNIVIHDTTALVIAAENGYDDIVSLLLGRGVDVDMEVHYTTALVAAVEGRHKHVVSLLLDRGADVNMLVNDTTALVVAVQKGYMDLVSLLLYRGADVNMVVNDTTALLVAVETQDWRQHLEDIDTELDYDIVPLLLDRGADVNMVVDDTTVLVTAVKKGYKGIVQLLLNQGADVNMVVCDTTALAEAVQGWHEKIVMLLLDRGADVNMVVDNTTVLVTAVRKGYNIVSLLLDRGADVNTVVNDTTALVAAMEGGHKAVVLLLLDRGADVNMVVHNTTALVVAVEKRYWDFVLLSLRRGGDMNIVINNTTALQLVERAKDGRLDIVSQLLDRGEDVNMVVNDTTALVAAAENGYQDIVSLLLDRGADVNMVVHDTTALVAAMEGRHKAVVSLLLDRGADVNMVVHDSTALVAAAENGYQDTVSLLLDRGADVNMVVHNTTALVAAAENGYQDIVLLLLHQGADVNLVAHDTTALVAAAENGYQDIVLLLLRQGADVNLVAGNTTALIAATCRGYKDIVSRLLDGGADVNIVAGQYGTALIAAICKCHPPTRIYIQQSALLSTRLLLSMLLDRNPNVSIRAGVYGTALIAAISQLPDELQSTGTVVQSSNGWQLAFLDRLLSSVYITQDHIHTAVGEYGTPLAAAISRGNLQFLRLLVDRGGDIGRVGDSCGIALTAASATGWDSQRLYNILQFLVHKGADINVVSSQQFGSALGQAAYMGNTGLVSFLLGCGADPFHVGGTHYRAALGGAYPNALDCAALSPSNKAQSDLVAMLSNAMNCSEKFRELQRLPPFPMPYTRSTLRRITTVKTDSGPSTCSDPEGICGLPTYAALTTQHADIPCAVLGEELTVKVLVQLVIGIGIDMPEFKCYEDWIQNDVRYFVTQGYDFGEAYAAARVGWRHFNKPGFVHLVEQYRGRWHRIAQKIDKERVNSIHRDNMEQEMIKLPYEVMPRRLWDLKSNRVVEFRMLHSELLAYRSTVEHQFGKFKALTNASHLASTEVPRFWAISHSWESGMDLVEIPINQYQWQVPLPHGLDLEHDVRWELLGYGIEYAWLDVLCLRQHTASNLSPSNSHISKPAELNATKIEEWKLDVPTIGNIYRVAQGIVRYFNGLGRLFSSEGWDGERHWLQRAWTLQEIKTENSTINGGIPRGSSASTSNIMNICGKMAGEAISLRRAIRPVLKLAADVDTPNGCSLYALVREMSQRRATKSTDKVAGLVYLLRLTQLPTYNEKAEDNDVWVRCFHMLPLARKIELLFDFPYRSEKQYWFPTWNELMTWPEVNPDCDYSPARQPEGPGIQDLVDLPEYEVATEGSLFMFDIWALSHCHVTRGSVDYDVKEKATSKVYGFYGPYVLQKPIESIDTETTSSGQQCEFTIATADLGNSNNWVLCKVVKKLKAKCNPPGQSRSSELGPEDETCESGEMPQQSSEIEIEVLRKVGVLRTDFCGEMLAGADAQGDRSALRRIHALFV